MLSPTFTVVKEEGCLERGCVANNLRFHISCFTACGYDHLEVKLLFSFYFSALGVLIPLQLH